jgi:hypothetical protein
MNTFINPEERLDRSILMLSAAPRVQGHPDDFISVEDSIMGPVSNLPHRLWSG